jgi:hypothetical protein
MQHSKSFRYNARDFLELFGKYKYMAAFEAYLDESGTHRGSKITIVGGAFAKVASWANIMNQWNRVLHRRDFGLEYFHYKEINNHETALGKLGDDKKERLLSLFAGILTDREQVDWLAFGIDEGLLHDILMNEFPKFIKMTAYMLGAELCFSYIQQWVAHKKHISRMPIMFEQGQKTNSLLLANARRWFGEKSLQDSYHIGPLMFDSKEIWPQLQAADFIVGESYRAALALKSNGPFREQFIKLGSKGKGRLIIMDASHIRRFLKPLYEFWLNYVEQKRKRRTISSSS